MFLLNLATNHFKKNGDVNIDFNTLLYKFLMIIYRVKNFDDDYYKIDVIDSYYYKYLKYKTKYIKLKNIF